MLQTIWTPGDTLRERAHRDRAPYDVWSQQGWLRTPDGKTLDPEVVRQRIVELRSIVQIVQIGFDPWHADAPIKNLVSIDGFAETQVLAVPQTYASLSSAERRFQSEVLEGRVDADGCPVTAWAVSNTVDQQDGKGNIFFTKKKSRGRIDPVKSATTAMALALRAQPETDKFQMIFVGAPRG
jgi:phage terminase large subunit-like protein